MPNLEKRPGGEFNDTEVLFGIGAFLSNCLQDVRPEPCCKSDPDCNKQFSKVNPCLSLVLLLLFCKKNSNCHCQLVSLFVVVMITVELEKRL